MKNLHCWLAGTVLLAHAMTHAHDAGSHAKGHAASTAKIEQQVFGIAGDRKKLHRTVIIDMTDDMRFAPAELRVKQGDTVRFVLRNRGKLMHEWVLGTEQELKKHAELMRTLPQMKHDEAHMAHVDPGGVREVVWHFNRPGKFSFACLMAGHYESGMVGSVLVEPANAAGR
jgi:uncharacterized cupredoxin-like copper-binding protein